MGKAIDLTGLRVGKLFVVEKTEKRAHRHILWRCLCDCGNEVLKTTSHLSPNTKCQNIRSCGCLLKENGPKCKVTPEDGAIKELLKSYKAGAKNRGYVWRLSDEEFLHIIQQDCIYCGESPRYLFRHRKILTTVTANGIDRVNSKKGYTLKNCVPCCRFCNRAKFMSDAEEFGLWIARVRCYPSL